MRLAPTPPAPTASARRRCRRSPPGARVLRNRDAPASLFPRRCFAPCFLFPTVALPAPQALASLLSDQSPELGQEPLDHAKALIPELRAVDVDPEPGQCALGRL